MQGSVIGRAHGQSPSCVIGLFVTFMLIFILFPVIFIEVFLVLLHGWRSAPRQNRWGSSASQSIVSAEQRFVSVGFYDTKDPVYTMIYPGRVESAYC